MTSKEFREMSPVAKRMCVASLDGWDNFTDGDGSIVAIRKDGDGHFALVPNYPFDLAAMKEAVKRLPEDLRDYREEGNFWNALIDASGADTAECMGKATEQIAMATAEQWAEAYVITQMRARE